jgi:hypothetical protein
MLGKMSWQQFLLNACKISSEYCAAAKKKWKNNGRVL